MKGAWSNSATYEALDGVTAASGFYIAKQNVPAGTALSDSTYWQKAIDGSLYLQSIKMVRYTFTSSGSLAPGSTYSATEDISSSIPSGYSFIGATPEYAGDDQFSWAACVTNTSNNTVSIIVRNDSSSSDSGAPRVNLLCVM